MDSKRSIILFIITLLTCTSIGAQTETIDGVTYDVVTITVNAPSYDSGKPPVFATVKYNKLCPLVTTSDDMGSCELNRNWAYFNGYPAFDSKDAGHIPTGSDFLESPYNPSALAIQNQTLKRDSHQPLTYSDGTGGVRRFTGTSAIWPHHINGGNYTLMTNQDPKVMIRTRWSFAQHDVDNDYTTDAATIAGRFKALSDLWEGITGVGLKVMVEPTGDHRYIDAGKQSEEICWNIFQNGVVGTYPEMTNVLISDWTAGTDWTSFSSKPAETTRRIFFQGNEQTWKDAINSADGTKILLGGTHGIGDDILLFMKELAVGGSSAKADQLWVAGADEVWEYYHLYNNALIQNVHYADGVLTFQVKLPQYKKHQFRELTINIPGVSGATGCTFSDNVVIGAGQQNSGQYTVNIGLESRLYTHIEELISYYRAHLYNTYVKDDAQYLINLLKPGTKRDGYQAQLDAEPAYSYTVKNNLGGIIVSDAVDEAEAVSYGFPRYVLSGTELYETPANATRPYYVNTFTPTGKNQEIIINYTKALDNVVYYSEGEDLEGAGYNPVDKSKVNNSSNGEYLVYQNGSGGAGGIITSSPVTTLQPGKYKLVTRLGDSWNSIEAGRTAVFTFKLGDKTVYTCQTRTTGLEEFTKEDIVVKQEQQLTVEATNCGVSRWMDYLYIQKTGDYDATNPDVSLTVSAVSLDVTDEVGTVAITATTTPKAQGATITQTVIKDANGNILASESGNTCTYIYTPIELGDIVFTAEGTDSDGKTGLSDEQTVSVTSDFILQVTSNLGDELVSTTFKAQKAPMTHIYVYPQYLLKGTTLYETSALSNNAKELHFGEILNFTIANNKKSSVVNYEPVAANIVFYTEGEDISGSRTWTWNSYPIDFGKGEAFALSLCSMGAGGAVTSADVTTLPAGTYKIYAGLGTTNSATYTFKLGGTTFDTYATAASNVVNQYVSDSFTLDEATTLSVSCNKGKDNSQNWIDYLYIQKLDDLPVTITDAGYATFSSHYALDFTNSGINAYTATVDGDKVTMNKVEGSVPAATGLFLQGTVGETVSKDIPLATDVPAAISNNALMPHLETGLVAAGNYVFSRDKTTGDLSFRRLASDTEVLGGRSYLSISGSSARSLTIVMDNVTGIRLAPVGASTQTSPAYNIQGNPVSEHTKGIIISNGRKHINTKKP